MIIEQYVSFETAKLLKEKGFDIECNSFYRKSFKNNKIVDKPELYLSTFFKNNSRLKESDYSDIVYCSAPSQSLVMRWLREVHNLVIEPYRTACGYLYTISNIPNGSTLYDNGDAYNGDDENSGQWTTWENACEDGIKYCLNHLI